ncbi:hypothetical protein [Duodenibacillus massiliensis]|uniref:hypothetical protein n=1 Tax=Duodenibacillus massiliensis TaxID=1852381 RepID=UPI003F821F70
MSLTEILLTSALLSLLVLLYFALTGLRKRVLHLEMGLAKQELILGKTKGLLMAKCAKISNLETIVGNLKKESGERARDGRAFAKRVAHDLLELRAMVKGARK